MLALLVGPSVSKIPAGGIHYHQQCWEPGPQLPGTVESFASWTSLQLCRLRLVSCVPSLGVGLLWRVKGGQMGLGGIFTSTRGPITHPPPVRLPVRWLLLPNLANYY